MAPLSRTRRKLYLAALVAVFAVMTPILIGYAQGYRLSDLGDAFKLIRTGGIYVGVGESGVTVSVDEDERETTSFISRNALVQNLFSGSYRVAVSKPGYQTWEKTLQVYPELVTEWRPALLPEPVPVAAILKTLPAEPVATGTPVAKPSPNPRYAEVVALFAPATATKATSTKAVAVDSARLSVVAALAEAGRRDLEKEPTLKVLGGVGAWLRGGTLRFAWLGDPEATPHYLCSPDGSVDESVVSLPNPVLWFDFALGRSDIFAVTTKTGLWLVEADGRGGRNATLLKAGAGLEARVADSVIYVRQGAEYWEIRL
jgi:hypothetical protein